MHPGRRRSGMGVMLLFYQLFGVIGIDKIPPVTLGCIGLQAAIFLRLFKLPWHSASQVCISAYNVWRKKEYLRLLYGAVEHLDDWHLYYNMCSFALKGQSLERRLGSLRFLYIVSCFTVLTNIVLVALNVFASEFFDYKEYECAVGFSGVIFALKVLTTYYDHNHTHQIMGVPVIMPAKYVVWIELVLIQLLVPNVSFFGHLAGVLVGMAYVKGPLKSLLDFFFSMITGIFKLSQPRFTQHAQRSGYANDNFSRFVPPGMSEEEQLRRAMEESIEESFQRSSNSVPPYPNTPRDSAPPPPGFIFGDDLYQPPPAGFAPDIEEIRRRRNERFTSY